MLKKVIEPYIVDTRKRLNLLDNHKALLIWDDFKAHWTPDFVELAESMNIEIVKIPANFTHLLSPLDLTVRRQQIIEKTRTDRVF